MSDAFLASFARRRVLVTGHTGFKGSWLSLWLARRGAIVAGYALEPPTAPSNFVAARVEEVLAEHHVADIRDRDRLGAVIEGFRPEVIFHLAAQTVVLDGYATPSEAFAVNVMGTVNLLDVVRVAEQPCAIVAVSTDKVYANDESGRPFTEADPLGGRDPYSASKAASELAVAAYRASFFPPESIDAHGIALASARAGNVIGGGDWTPHGLVADTFKALAAGQPVRLRNPASIRPWQHVLEPLAGYLRIAVALQSPERSQFCRAWNLGPQREESADVRHVVEGLITGWGTGTWLEVDGHPTQHEADVLRLSAVAAQREIGAVATWSLDEALRRTARWNRAYLDDPERSRDACWADIDAYEASIGT
ncbi:MAG: CDP-glucose 4,6-dehydratase [Chloroflexi bacterium]|nr:CDP-glucose 4,6-dehydratase [Chloroflexota bacterium]